MRSQNMQKEQITTDDNYLKLTEADLIDMLEGLKMLGDYRVIEASVSEIHHRKKRIEKLQAALDALRSRQAVFNVIPSREGE